MAELDARRIEGRGIFAGELFALCAPLRRGRS